MHRRQARHHRIEDSLWNLFSIKQNRIGFHQMPDITDQQKASTVQYHGISIRITIASVAIELTANNTPAFVKLFSEISFHQPEPISINLRLIFSVNRGDRILAILNR